MAYFRPSENSSLPLFLPLWLFPFVTKVLLFQLAKKTLLCPDMATGLQNGAETMFYYFPFFLRSNSTCLPLTPPPEWNLNQFALPLSTSCQMKDDFPGPSLASYSESECFFIHDTASRPLTHLNIHVQPHTLTELFFVS